jgi:chromosome partitioning protein
MSIILFAGEKGGTGKSPLTYQTAICMLVRGLDVLLVDGDIQRTSAQFCERRDALCAADPSRRLRPIPFAEKRSDMANYLDNVRSKYDHVLVDLRGVESPQMSSALLFADIVYSPFSPGLSSLETASAMFHAIELARTRGNRELRSASLLTLVDPRSSVRRQVVACSQVLEPFVQHLPISPIVMRTYNKAYSISSGLGQGVVELAHHSDRETRESAINPAADLWRLYSEITGDEVATPEEEQVDEQTAE